MHKTRARGLLTAFCHLPDALRTVCQHGHQLCSATPDGPCLTDVINDAVINVDEPSDNDENLGDC